MSKENNRRQRGGLERIHTILLVGVVDIEKREVVAINVRKPSLSFIGSFLSIPWAEKAIGH